MSAFQFGIEILKLLKIRLNCVHGFLRSFHLVFGLKLRLDELASARASSLRCALFPRISNGTTFLAIPLLSSAGLLATLAVAVMLVFREVRTPIKHASERIAKRGVGTGESSKSTCTTSLTFTLNVREEVVK